MILRKKEELLSLENPVQFIFSHSALGVGWDNPNVFNIATLSNSYSETKKRQEIGRGLRICVNQKGERVYDPLDVKDDERINRLNVFPNESYETFVEQYQSEIREVYGDEKEGAGIGHTNKGKPDKIKSIQTQKDSIKKAFDEFWNRMSRKTDFSVSFDEEKLVKLCAEALSSIKISDYRVQLQGTEIVDISEDGIAEHNLGHIFRDAIASYSPVDIVEEISENTQLSYNTIFNIFRRIKDKSELVKNPPVFLHNAIIKINQIELNEMVRGIKYELTGESIPFNFGDVSFDKTNQTKIADTPNRGFWNKLKVDSDIEKYFAEEADRDNEVLCLLKLPDYYTIPTPAGPYTPDFGLVLSRTNLDDGSTEDFNFVIEIKATNDINNTKVLRQSEINKIKCAVKHFESLGVEARFEAPVKEYEEFKKKVENGNLTQ